MNPIKVSVILSVYNEPIEWLKISIESVLGQTFKDFEFIIINDNPNNKDIKILLEEYSIRDSRIILINNNVNIGLTKSLNRGLEISKGKYIARMDADDISKSTRFEQQYNFLENNQNYIACGSCVRIINENTLSNKILKKPLCNRQIKAYLFCESPIIHPTFFFRNHKNIFYDPNYLYSQDFDFITKLAKVGKLYNFEEPLLQYRISVKQITSQKLTEQNLYSKNIKSKNIIEYISKKNPSIVTLDNFENVKLAFKIVKKDLIRFGSKDRVEKSYIFYSLIMYFIKPSFKRSFFIIIFVLFLNLKFRLKIRMLLSIFLTFKDQNK